MGSGPNCVGRDDESVNSLGFRWKLLSCGGKALSVCSSYIAVSSLTHGLFFLLRTSPNLIGGGGNVRSLVIRRPIVINFVLLPYFAVLYYKFTPKACFRISFKANLYTFFTYILCSILILSKFFLIHQLMHN
jgi:hypothetical protein